MNASKNYYEAYDDRYRQVHSKNLRWFSAQPSAIVGEVIASYGISTSSAILELGCGEGRDAVALLKHGFDLTATDISSEAIAFCRKNDPGHRDNYRVLDCLHGKLEQKYDFIFAVAVLHMLVEDEDRSCFYQFIKEHLTESGIALISTMGDGTIEFRSDIRKAFELQLRRHDSSGEEMLLAGTSCRVVSFETFLKELHNGEFTIREHGYTEVKPDFPEMMYAVVSNKS